MIEFILENKFLMAQIAGFLAMSCCVISMQFKHPRNIILTGVPSGLLWATQYMLLNAPMGAIANASGALKNLLITFLPKSFVPHLLLFYLFLMWGIGLYNLEVWYALLPLIGASATSVALLINRDNRELYARSIVLCCSLWACYNITVGAYMGLACDTLTILSSIIGMARHERWEIGRCYRTFFPSLGRSLFPNLRTYP
ncbi:MAG: YgjV family protein [Pseudomonadota bacterium]